MVWLGALAAALTIVAVANVAYLAWYFHWERRNTSGMAYYGRPLAERRALKHRMRRLSWPAKPFVRLLALMARSRTTMPAFDYEGVAGPTTVSSPEIFERARRYRPRPEDVFVVTQMRSGTTWMQQLVYEIVSHGRGDLTDAGHGPLYAISPWIDGLNSVSISDAPLVGVWPTRLIKSHLPTALCPYDEHAKYIYVARHPVACFASIVDFNRSLSGPAAPPVAALVEWFCSDRMYWSPWPRHVQGWWEWAEARDNVLFVHFEEMKRDFNAVRDRVAHFLRCPLTPEDAARVTHRCSFEFMKAHEELFEMAPPTMFSVAGGRFLASGKFERHGDVTPAVRNRIVEYCRAALRGGPYPAHRFYPDLTDSDAREYELFETAVRRRDAN